MVIEKVREYFKTKGMYFVIFIFLITLCGCGNNNVPYDYDFVNVCWTRTTEADTEFLRFSDEGSFSYYCACGNSINDSDLCEGYTYNPDTNIVRLKYCEKTKDTISKIKVVEYTDNTLLLDFNGDMRTFTREEAGEEYITPDTVNYEGRTYIYLECNEDIFYYDLNVSTYLEEDIIHPIPSETWDVVYYNGNVFILDSDLQNAKAYYGDDSNYEWSVEIDSTDSEDIYTYPLSVSADELEVIYGFEDAEKDTTLLFDEMEKFAMLKKTSADGLICASISLACYDGAWYYRSEVIDEQQEGWPEYVYKLPNGLNEQILAIKMGID